jgi:hypothetical protein
MVLVAVGVVAVLAPGLGDVRQRLEGVQPGWPGVAIVLEMLSCVSYVPADLLRADVAAHELPTGHVERRDDAAPERRAPRRAALRHLLSDI